MPPNLTLRDPSRPARRAARRMRCPLACAIVVLFASIVAAQDAPTRAPTLVERLLAGASAQIGVTVSYDGSYRRIAYPLGDVPVETGVCTDVVVRAYRAAGIDLQQRVHEDMRAAFARYPQSWGRRGPDPNIDHRRVPNLAAFFTRHGEVLPRSGRAQDYRPGDIVTWRLPGGYTHIGIVSDESADGTPLVIHNIGAGTRREDVLFRYAITGHFRYPSP